MPQETEAEKLEAEKLRLWIAERKVQAFEYLRHLSDASPELLKASGYRDKGDALVSVMKSATREIERRVVAHEKKFPH